jgi:hypothetical protein
LTPKKEMIFEGQYLYDSRIRGKFYLDNKLEFEGEYLFNKKWTGYGYDEKGNIIYTLINGNGKVKEYYNNGNLQYEGEIINGKYFKGKNYSYNGTFKDEGEFNNG